jgi:hypothetical protein
MVAIDGGNGFLSPDLVHPNTINTASDRLSANGNYGIEFQFANAGIETVVLDNDVFFMSVLFGGRYATMTQDLRVEYTNLDTISVESEIDFFGFGPQVGLNLEVGLGCGFWVFSSARSSFLIGEFRSNSIQRNDLSTAIQSIAGFEDDRLVTQLELQLGAGWQGCDGRLRLMVGYYLGSWLNVVSTQSFIEAIRNDKFKDVDDSLTIGGLTARIEARF